MLEVTAQITFKKEITRFHYGEHIPSSFSIGYLLGKKFSFVAVAV